MTKQEYGLWKQYDLTRQMVSELKVARDACIAKLTGEYLMSVSPENRLSEHAYILGMVHGLDMTLDPVTE